MLVKVLPNTYNAGTCGGAGGGGGVIWLLFREHASKDIVTVSRTDLNSFMVFVFRFPLYSETLKVPEISI